MAVELYVSTTELSARTLRKPANELNAAWNAMECIDTYPTYVGPNGRAAIYTQSVLSEIASIKRQLRSLSDNMQQYNSIVSCAPEELSAIDASFKNEITTWYERGGYYGKDFYTKVKTAVETPIKYWVNDYKNKGVSYKIIQSIAAIGRAAPAVIGCAVSWATAPWAPSTWLSTAYGVNAAISMWADLDNIWNENYDQVGKVNMLKDALVDGGGELSKMVCGNEKIGELVGNGVYTLGAITTTVTNAGNLNTLKGRTMTTDPMKQVGDKIKSKLGGGEKGVFGLRGQVIQSDYSWENVKGAVKEAPKAVKGVWDIFTNSPISEVSKDLKLLSYTVPNVAETISAVELLGDVANTTAELTKTGIEFVKTIIS